MRSIESKPACPPLPIRWRERYRYRLWLEPGVFRRSFRRAAIQLAVAVPAIFVLLLLSDLVKGKSPPITVIGLFSGGVGLVYAVAYFWLQRRDSEVQLDMSGLQRSAALGNLIRTQSWPLAALEGASVNLVRIGQRSVPVLEFPDKGGIARRIAIEPASTAEFDVPRFLDYWRGLAVEERAARLFDEQMRSASWAGKHSLRTELALAGLPPDKLRSRLKRAWILLFVSIFLMLGSCAGPLSVIAMGVKDDTMRQVLGATMIFLPLVFLVATILMVLDVRRFTALAHRFQKDDPDQHMPDMCRRPE